MKISTVFFLVIAKEVIANNLRGVDDTPESRQLQTIIDARSSSRDRGRSKGQALFIVKDDDSRSTSNCAYDTKDEFDGDFDDIFIVTDDDDARNGDIVAVIDHDTDCPDLWDDIEQELEDRHSQKTVYVYYGNGRKYYRNRNKRGYRLYYGRKYNNRSKKRSSGSSNRRRWWKGNGHGGGWHGEGDGGGWHGGGWHGSGDGGGWHGDEDEDGDGWHGDGNGGGDGGGWHGDENGTGGEGENNGGSADGNGGEEVEIVEDGLETEMSTTPPP